LTWVSRLPKDRRGANQLGFHTKTSRRNLMSLFVG
jgi:hypothetical protein